MRSIMSRLKRSLEPEAPSKVPLPSKLDIPRLREPPKPRKSLAPVRAAVVKEIMDKAVVGQEAAKEQLSVLIAMHLGWDYQASENQTPPNALIIGPTGSGKTHSIATAAQGLDIPIIVIDATTLTPTGNENGLSLYKLPSHIQEESEGHDKCIVFIDEFDKINQIPSDKNQWWSRHIQKGLLKIIEGRVPLPVKPLFFVGGAFQNIEQLERDRSAEVSRMMRDAPRGTLVSEDFINYGFMPELIARIPAVVQFQRLQESELHRILENDEYSPLYIWKKHFLSVNKEIEFSQEFKNEVVKRAYSLNLGARGLQQIIFPALSKAAYRLETSADSKLVVGPSILRFLGD